MITQDNKETICFSRTVFFRLLCSPEKILFFIAKEVPIVRFSDLFVILKYYCAQNETKPVFFYDLFLALCGLKDPYDLPLKDVSQIYRYINGKQSILFYARECPDYNRSSLEHYFQTHIKSERISSLCKTMKKEGFSMTKNNFAAVLSDLLMDSLEEDRFKVYEKENEK